jgi:hypothetical protein
VFVALVTAVLAGIYLLWHNSPPANVMEVIIFAGFIVGIIGGVIRRPRPLEAALLADHQLNLAELFSSVWLSQQAHPSERHPWSALLLADASFRCRSINTSSLRFRRFGASLWGATILAFVLAVTVLLLGPTRPPHPGAHELALAAGSSTTPTNTIEAGGKFLTPDERPILPGDPDDPQASKFGQNNPPTADHSPKDSATDATPDLHSQNVVGDTGHGGGSARTDGRPPVAPETPNHPTGPGEVASHNNGKAGTGDGAGTTDAFPSSDNHANGGLRSAGSKGESPAPPWQSSDWAAKVEQAHQAVDSGQIPAIYRDLVQKYFSPIGN